MKDTYLNDQNVSNNIIIKDQRQNSPKKKKLFSSEKSISYSSSVDDKNETIDNQINDSTSSFDYSDTLRVSDFQKREKTENFFTKGKNILRMLSKAISENFENFNKQRKTHITNIDLEKNKKNINMKHKRTTSDNNKFEGKIKNKRLDSSNQNRNRNFLLNRINASKSLNNKENLGINKIHKLSIGINNEKEDEKDIKENKCKNIKEKTNSKNNNIKICKNVNINILTKKSKNLTTKNPPQKNTNIKQNLKSSNEINKSLNIKKSKDSQQKQISNNNIQKNTNNITKNLAETQEFFKKLNSHNQYNNQQRLTYVETPLGKNNTNMTPRLTVPVNFLKENISTQNIFHNANRTKQINLDQKLIHKQSKSPKNIAVANKLFSQETNDYKQINNTTSSNNMINKHSVSPNPNNNKFGRQTVCQKNIINNNISNNNQLVNSMNNLCKVRKINSNINYSTNINNNISKQNNINNSNTNNIYTNINNQIFQNQLIFNYPISQNNSGQRLTISTYPINNNNIIYSQQRLTNIPTQVQLTSPEINNILNQLNTNISLNFNVLKNYGILSHPGKDTSGHQKTNQDSFTFFSNINSLKNFNIFGVLDGHGTEGHFVSRFASKFIPYQIMNNPEIKNLRDTEMIYNKLKSNNYQIIVKAYLDCDIALQKVNFDAKESGSTCNLIINIGNKIICANTGDSRAIVVFDDYMQNNNYKCIPLSIDFKPEMPEEMSRILLNGGEVRQIKNEIGEGVGPYRVWKRGEGYPGLAMSRSIGDLNGKKIGVIPNPGIVEYQLDENSKYIVVCSDGVWEFLNNENVKNIGNKHYLENNPGGFCRELINTSLCLWEKNDIVIDDITAVVAFF